MTKHKIGMGTRNTLCLVIVIFSDEVVKMNFLLLCEDRYLFNVVSDNIYLNKGSKENVISTSITENIIMSR